MQLPPWGPPQMRLYVYETGGRSVAAHQSKPGGSFVKVCDMSPLPVSLHVCRKAICRRTVWTCVCVCIILWGLREENKVMERWGLHGPASPSFTLAATCLRGFQYPVCVCVCATSPSCLPKECSSLYQCVCVCVCRGYYILTYTQMKPEGCNGTVFSPVKKKEKRTCVRLERPVLPLGYFLFTP